MKKQIAAGALGATLILIPMTAQAWWAWNRHEVLPVSDGVFEVVSRVGSGAQQFWCGAGDFVYRGLGLPNNQRVYIWKAIGPSVNRPGKKAVQFSTTAPPGANTTPGYSLSVKAVGDNLQAVAAQQYCFGDDPFEDVWRW